MLLFTPKVIMTIGSIRLRYVVCHDVRSIASKTEAVNRSVFLVMERYSQLEWTILKDMQNSTASRSTTNSSTAGFRQTSSWRGYRTCHDAISESRHVVLADWMHASKLPAGCTYARSRCYHLPPDGVMLDKHDLNDTTTLWESDATETTDIREWSSRQ